MLGENTADKVASKAIEDLDDFLPDLPDSFERLRDSCLPKRLAMAVVETHLQNVTSTEAFLAKVKPRLVWSLLKQSSDDLVMSVGTLQEMEKEMDRLRKIQMQQSKTLEERRRQVNDDSVGTLMMEAAVALGDGLEESSASDLGKEIANVEYLIEAGPDHVSLVAKEVNLWNSLVPWDLSHFVLEHEEVQAIRTSFPGQSVPTTQDTAFLNNPSLRPSLAAYWREDTYCTELKEAYQEKEGPSDKPPRLDGPSDAEQRVKDWKSISAQKYAQAVLGDAYDRSEYNLLTPKWLSFTSPDAVNSRMELGGRRRSKRAVHRSPSSDEQLQSKKRPRTQTDPGKSASHQGDPQAGEVPAEPTLFERYREHCTACLESASRPPSKTQVSQLQERLAHCESVLDALHPSFQRFKPVLDSAMAIDSTERFDRTKVSTFDEVVSQLAPTTNWQLLHLKCIDISNASTGRSEADTKYQLDTAAVYSAHSDWPWKSVPMIVDLAKFIYTQLDPKIITGGETLLEMLGPEMKQSEQVKALKNHDMLEGLALSCTE